MSDEEKRWPFDGFYLKLVEAQREYEQEQHIDSASLTEEERQQKLQEILDCIKASRKKKKEANTSIVKVCNCNKFTSWILQNIGIYQV